MKIHGLVDSWGFQLVIVFGSVGWFLEMAWKKHPSKDVSPSPAIFGSSWLLSRMVFAVCPWSKTLLPSMLKRRRGCGTTHQRSMMFCQRFTKIHPPPIHNTWKAVRWCTLLQTCEFFNDVCCPGPRIGWRAKAGKLSSLRIFHPLGKSWWMWWGIFVYLLSWNTVMLHEFFSFSWVTVEWEL